jgi:hypothetical protein
LSNNCYRGVRRGPGLSEDMHRRAVDALYAERDRQRAEDVRVLALAKKHGTTPEAIRTAEAEKAAADAAAKRRQDLDAARRATAPDSGPPVGLEVTVGTIRAALDAWEGSWPPTQPTFCDRLPVGDRRLRQILNSERTDWKAELGASDARRTK